MVRHLMACTPTPNSLSHIIVSECFLESEAALSFKRDRGEMREGRSGHLLSQREDMSQSGSCMISLFRYQVLPHL